MSPLSPIPSNALGLMPRVDTCPSELAPLPASPEIAKPETINPAQSADGDSFATMLGRMVADVNAQQNIANQTVNALQSGQNVPLHQAVIAMEEANVSFQLMVEVRNRLLDAYQEIMRMQI
ncbi:MAG TPA: flagellar hook-basal body complex protein FliE [Candidatus Sulfopaludibacter sp.]|nr:flagellar hook-basal body complex protein FliE [Candidatus Sulfopaludibacter sp.]